MADSAATDCEKICALVRLQSALISAISMCISHFDQDGNDYKWKISSKVTF